MKRTLICCIFSFEWFPGFWILCADVSEQSVCSICIGLVNKENKLNQISRVFFQVKIQFKRSLRQLEGRRRCVQVQEQAVEGSGPKWRPAVRQELAGGTAPCGSEEEEPWNVSDLLCCRWLSPFFKQVQKGFPRSSHGQSIISLHAVWVHFQFNGFPDESIHVSGFCGNKLRTL